MEIIQLEKTDFINLLRATVREEIASLTIGANDSNSNQPLSVEAAAKFLDRPVSSIYQLVHKNEIPHSKKGRKLYFDKAELTQWVNAGRVLTAAELRVEANNVLVGK